MKARVRDMMRAVERIATPPRNVTLHQQPYGTKANIRDDNLHLQHLPPTISATMASKTGNAPRFAAKVVIELTQEVDPAPAVIDLCDDNDESKLAKKYLSAYLSSFNKEKAV